jgi:hypothetical protein
VLGAEGLVLFVVAEVLVTGFFLVTMDFSIAAEPFVSLNYFVGI